MRLTQNAYSSLLEHTKQILLVTICDVTAGIESGMERVADRAPTHLDRQTEMLKYLCRFVWMKDLS